MKHPSPADNGTGQLPVSYEIFLATLRKTARGAAISPNAFRSSLSLTQQDLARLAHVHRVTVSRQPTNSQVQSYIRDSLRVLSGAAEINRDFPQAVFWFRNEPLKPFRHKTAEQLVSEGRAEDVLAYIESLQAGAAG